MRPISKRIRDVLSRDPWMTRCANCGSSIQVQWHHPFKYAGKQINEVWSLVPLCDNCHNHDVTGLIKGDFSKLISLVRAMGIYGIYLEMVKIKYPKTKWEMIYDYLINGYEYVVPNETKSYGFTFSGTPPLNYEWSCDGGEVINGKFTQQVSITWDDYYNGQRKISCKVSLCNNEDLIIYKNVFENV